MKGAVSDWQIMHALFSDGPQTVAELVERTSLQKQSIHKALLRLERRQMVAIEGWAARGPGQSTWPMKWAIGPLPRLWAVRHAVGRGQVE